MRKITILLATLLFTACGFSQSIKNINRKLNTDLLKAKTQMLLNNKSGKDIEALSKMDSVLQSWSNTATPSVYLNKQNSGDWGYLIGHNNYGDYAWAEKYAIKGSAKVNFGMVRFYGVAKSNDSTTCFILDNNFNPIGFSLPVANKDLVLNNPPVQGHTVTFFQFPQPIQVTDTFYIGVMFNDYRNVSPLKDTISIYTTAQNERKNNFIYQNVYYTYINDTINLLDIKKSIGLNLNLMIAPVLDFCTLTVTSSADVTISKGQSTTLTQTNSGGTGNVNILWSTNPTFSDTTKITNALSVIVNPTTTTKYYVLAVTKDGCVAEDSVLVTVNNANGISSINAVDNLTIYPSPANDVLNIRFNSQEMQNVNVKIYNVIGKLVYNVNTSATNGEFNKTIDVKSLTKGLYLVQIESAKGTISRKVEIR